MASTGRLKTSGQGHAIGVQLVRRRGGRRGNAWGTTLVSASAGAGAPLAGVLSRALLEGVSGGQPLLLRQHGERGRLVAVLLDPDSYAELEASAQELLAQDLPA